MDEITDVIMSPIMSDILTPIIVILAGVPWILDTGIWNDAGEWKDESIWNDGV